jgi:hypothetical protein
MSSFHHIRQQQEYQGQPFIGWVYTFLGEFGQSVSAFISICRQNSPSLAFILLSWPLPALANAFEYPIESLQSVFVINVSPSKE